MAAGDGPAPLWRRLRAEAVEQSWWLRFPLAGAAIDGWRDAAVCRGFVDLFYSREPDDMAAACEACRHCPVRRECLQEGFAVERTMPLFDVEWSGVLGGFTPAERLAWWREHRDLRDIRPAFAACGTDAGYHAHRRQDEPACDPCKAAHTAAEATRQQRERVRREGHTIASQGLPGGRIRVLSAAMSSERHGRAAR